MGHNTPEFHHGEMDITEQRATFHAAMLGTKWGALAIAVFLVFSTLFFCTGTGFVGSAFAAVVVAAIGVAVLQERRAAH